MSIPQPYSPTITQKSPESEVRLGRKYSIILHNDPVNEMLYVIECLIKVLHLAEPQATKVMMEAHTEGASLAQGGLGRELAEFYAEQLQAMYLTITIEPEE